MPKLVHNWKHVTKKAWSIRLGVLAAFFSGAEVVLPLFADDIPRKVFAGLSFLAVVGAILARVVAQNDFD